MIPLAMVHQAHQAGLCVVPPAQDGSKRPWVPGGGGWKGYQQTRPSLALLKQWYDPSNGLTGMGLVCGKVSGGLEVMDFDTREAWDEFRKMAEYCGVAPLVARVWAGYGEESPRGAHLSYRCSEIAGNTKLARQPDGKKAIIETRGEGGYIIIAPSNGSVHPSGAEYRCVSGSITSIVTITPAERKDLWEMAKSLTQFVPETIQATPAGGSANRPGEDFNLRATWSDVLEPHGWHKVFQRGDTTYWRRPDKTTGISATTGYAGTDFLFVFSTSTAFESERSYSKFGAFAALNHGGDFKGATKALAGQGYGEPAQNSEPDYQIFGKSAAKPAPDAAQSPESSSGEFISLADFIATPPVSTYLIKRVLPASGLGQVFGSSNVGKSFLLIDMACHIAAGMPWRGFKTNPCTVLYIAAEGLAGLAGRMKAWTQRHGILPDRLFIRPFPVGLTSAGAAAALAGRLTQLPELPRLIILDTLAANFGPGNENDAKDMGIALDALRMLGGQWLILCAHHSGHGDKTRSRGHSSLYAALDIELQVERPDPSGPIGVTHTKCRDMDRMEPLFFTLETERLPWADEDGEPVNSAVLVPAAKPDDVEEGGREPMAPLGRKQELALQLLRDMYTIHAANVGSDGVARVLLRDWYEAMEFENHRGNRSRIKGDLERRGLIKQVDSYVYLVD